MKTHKYNIVALFLMGSLAINGQTTNMGNITILPDTQMSIMDDFDNTTTANIMNDGELLVHANFNNDGLFSYSNAVNMGLTRFQGTNIQQITGSQLSEFYNIVFDNASVQNAFELTGDINVVNQADFINGVVVNDGLGGSITFENFADHSSASNDSHVDGEVLKKGGTDFMFPIGDQGSYRAARISAPDANNEIFSSQYFLENSNPKYPHHLKDGVLDVIDANEHWIVDRVSGSSDILLTLSWDASTTPAELIARPDLLHIVRWDTNLGYWIDEGGIIDEARQTVTTISEVSGYGVFTLARIKENVILPGELIVYNALTPNGNGQNDFLHIKGIDQFPDNSVKIYNRWGAKIFETRGYNETDNVFRGFSDGNLTVSRDKLLPAGTYFYVLEYAYQKETETKTFRKAGYLYINEN